ncbi:hypothetical protein [Variovorax sp. UC74_104]|uniref:hypothetical protein n=1 Tax=Variovorax sp. UC74_104 TaxID=3374555 RepID=UPI0037577DA4
MNYDNPAARLLALLQNGKRLERSTTCRTAWTEILDSNGSEALLMSRLGKVMELPQAAVTALQELYPTEDATWAHWQNQIVTAFASQQLHGPWQTFIDHIDDHTITYLKLSATLLQQRTTTKMVAGEDLRAIREELEKIVGDVLDSDQPAEIKKYLGRHLRKIIVSIDEYRLTGALPLLDSLESTLGHAALDKQYASFLTDHEIGRRVLDNLYAMANVITVAVGLTQISQAAALLLGTR